MYYHRAWAEIDLDAAAFNLEQIRKMISEESEIMVVVKANAYGHDAVRIARHLEDRGVWGFGVGDSKEALELRREGITKPILILGAIIEDEIESVVKNGISTCIHSWTRAELLEREAIRQGRRCPVHLMVDTGMGRLGVFPEHAPSLARRIAQAPGLIFEGVLTHYSCSALPDHDFTRQQLEKFMKVRADLEAEGIRPHFYHASNSGAILSGHPNPFNLVRTGIAVYGINAFDEETAGMQAPGPELKPVLGLKTQIIYMKDMPPNTPIGYGSLHVTREQTRIATIPLGYNDGLPYRVSNRGRVLLRGASVPIVGAVSMDYTMIDVGAVTGAAVGDRVTLIGTDGDERIRVEEIAELAGTIPYEITCGIGNRVQRIATRGPAKEFPVQETPEEDPRYPASEPAMEIR